MTQNVKWRKKGTLNELINTIFRHIDGYRKSCFLFYSQDEKFPFNIIKNCHTCWERAKRERERRKKLLLKFSASLS